MSRGVRAFPEISPALGIGLALGLTAGVGLFFVVRWHPTPAFLGYNLPIALPFAAGSRFKCHSRIALG